MNELSRTPCPTTLELRSRAVDAEVASIVDEFNRLAIQYFSLLADRSTELTVWLRRTEIAIAALYEAGLRLPLTEPSNQDAPEMPVGDERQLMIEISERLGGDGVPYSFVFHPMKTNDKPVVGTLADDLVSIYKDLYGGWALLAAGGRVEDVLWSWHINFQIHWGRHALGALQALGDMAR